MEIFQTFAEISIGILGFTAIAIMFRPYHDNWNNNMYQGMIGHSFQALIYSVLPFVLQAYHCKPSVVWTVCSIVLGTITFFQAVSVMIFDKKANIIAKSIMLVCSITVAILQLLNVLGIGTAQDKGPYIIGISWHIFQSLFIFTMIVTKKMDKDETPHP